MYSFIFMPSDVSPVYFAMQCILFMVTRKFINQAYRLVPNCSIVMGFSMASFYEWGWPLVSPLIEFIIESLTISTVCFWKEITSGNSFSTGFCSDYANKNNSE